MATIAESGHGVLLVRPLLMVTMVMVICLTDWSMAADSPNNVERQVPELSTGKDDQPTYRERTIQYHPASSKPNNSTHTSGDSILTPNPTSMSNYPAYHGGGGAAYPPQYTTYANSGPPPPPNMSAYDVNQYAYGYGAGYGYSYTTGAVPGFTVPAVQQCHYDSQNLGYQAPPTPVTVPMTSQLQMMEHQAFQTHLEKQQSLIEEMKQEMRAQQQSVRTIQVEEDSRPSKTQQPEISEEKMEEMVRERMKQAFVDELIRRERVSGTFEMTEGTVKPFSQYDDQDPVVVWYEKTKGCGLANKSWDCEVDCEYFNAAMKGLGTNDDAIIHIVSTRCNAQRQQMKKMFKTMYGKDLIKEVRGELSGDYKELVMALFVPPAEYDAWCIKEAIYYDTWCMKEAIYGPGTDEAALIEILLTRTNAQIQEMTKCYPLVTHENYYNKTSKIEKHIQDDTSGDFKRLLISACQGNRYEIPRERLEAAVEEIRNPETQEGTGMFQVNHQKLADNVKAAREAKELSKAGEERWGTDEETFIRIFATRDYYQMRETWNQYVKLTQRDILNSVDRETSGDFKAGLRAVVMNIRSRPMFFAESLVKAMKGLGTDERTLIRIIVSRSEIDMVQIKKCFLDLTKKTLWRWLKEDTSFNFKKLLQSIVGRD
ncbi:hypothetical protein ACOMHN_019794 [Nucella lapillus]